MHRQQRRPRGVNPPSARICSGDITRARDSRSPPASDSDKKINWDPGDTLETSGVLGKIKAQLRANVYNSLEEGDNVKSKSKLIKQCAQTSE